MPNDAGEGGEREKDGRSDVEISSCRTKYRLIDRERDENLGDAEDPDRCTCHM